MASATKASPRPLFEARPRRRPRRRRRQKRSRRRRRCVGYSDAKRRKPCRQKIAAAAIFDTGNDDLGRPGSGEAGFEDCLELRFRVLEESLAIRRRRRSLLRPFAGLEPIKLVIYLHTAIAMFSVQMMLQFPSWSYYSLASSPTTIAYHLFPAEIMLRWSSSFYSFLL